MIIGLLGAPNKGKSTLFNALTHSNVPVASYPFTTIDPNKAVGFVTVKCVESELNVTCCPRNGKCELGIRKIPINIIDVAGLVPDASIGKGMGSEFLGDVSIADALIIVADASGKTNEEGNVALTDYDVCNDVLMIMNELSRWLEKSLIKNLKKNRGKTVGEFCLSLKSLGYEPNVAEKAITTNGISNRTLDWTEEDMSKISHWLVENGKPMIIAANKMDLSNSEVGFEKLKERFGRTVFPISADMEFAINKAIEMNLIKNTENGLIFQDNKINSAITLALEKIKNFVQRHKTTGVQELINGVVFDFSRKIVVYPVEDDTHYSDHFLKVLPDALLLDQSSTPLMLSAAIHTDLEKGFLYAIDAKTKKRLGKNEQLQNGSVIKIVSAR